MRQAKPSLAHRLRWFMLPISIVVIASALVVPTLFDNDDPLNILISVALLAYWGGYAVVLAKDAVRRRD